MVEATVIILVAAGFTGVEALIALKAARAWAVIRSPIRFKRRWVLLLRTPWSRIEVKLKVRFTFEAEKH